MAVVVTHPGRQHSHQAALALDRAALLTGYWAGVPVVARQFERLPGFLRPRYAALPLDPRHVRGAPWCPAARRLGDRLLPKRIARWNDFAFCRLFDRWAASGLRGARPRAVLACEISALQTFRTAHQGGALAILDAPSMHHATQDSLHGTLDSRGLHRRIGRVKDAEIELADHIVTVSELARQTYLDAGVPAAKVHAVPLGADLDLFRPADAPLRDGVFTFLFAGATIFRKGFDLLLEAFDRVATETTDCRLVVVGPPGEAATALSSRDTRRISIQGPVDQRGLAIAMQAAHCLVLPSRNDSYGMVVPEALACGVPALVSDMVGAKDLIVEGVNGWVVPVGDVDALAQRMLRCVRDPERLAAMREDCRRSAEAVTWTAYHARFVELVTSLLAARRP